MSPLSPVWLCIVSTMTTTMPDPSIMENDVKKMGETTSQPDAGQQSSCLFVQLMLSNINRIDDSL